MDIERAGGQGGVAAEQHEARLHLAQPRLGGRTPGVRSREELINYVKFVY